MSTEQNKELIRQFYAASNRGDMDSCIALLADDLVWTVMGRTRFSGTYTGKQQVLEELVGPLFSQLKAGIHMTIEAMVAEGDRVVVQARGKAETHEGVPYNNPYLDIMRIEGGRIREVVEYLDTALVDKVFGPRE